jgi:hypothetical protein
MGIGSNRHTVTLEDAAGAPLDPATWDCAIQSMGMVVEGVTGHTLRGRYHPGINLETRARLGAQLFQVQNVTDIDLRHVELAVLVAEVVGRHGHE